MKWSPSLANEILEKRSSNPTQTTTLIIISLVITDAWYTKSSQPEILKIEISGYF